MQYFYRFRQKSSVKIIIIIIYVILRCLVAGVCMNSILHLKTRKSNKIAIKRGLLVAINVGGVLTRGPRLDILRGGTHYLCVKEQDFLMVSSRQDSNINVI